MVPFSTEENIKSSRARPTTINTSLNAYDSNLKLSQSTKKQPANRDMVLGLPQTIIFVGWSANSVRLLKALDERLNKDSVVHVLSLLPEHERKRDIEVANFCPIRIRIVHHMGETDKEAPLKRTIDAAVSMAATDAQPMRSVNISTKSMSEVESIRKKLHFP